MWTGDLENGKMCQFLVWKISYITKLEINNQLLSEIPVSIILKLKQDVLAPTSAT